MTNKPTFHFAVTQEVIDHINSNHPVIEDKELTVNDFIPTQGREKDTGYDARVAEINGINLKPGDYYKIKLGFRMFAPDGWYLRLNPRSGTFAKNNLSVLYGIIDECFEGENLFACQYCPPSSKLLEPDHTLFLPFGHRISQFVPAKRREMHTVSISNEEIDKMYAKRNASRGTGGFNSSGVK